MVEGLYSGLGSGAALSSMQLDVKMKLLVEAPAAVEDALASLLDHHDATLQVGHLSPHLLLLDAGMNLSPDILHSARRGFGDSLATRYL